MENKFGRIAAALVVVTVVGACAAPRAPLSGITDVVGPGGAVGGDVYATLRINGVDYPEYRGSHVIEVRADDATKKSDDETREIMGALCLLRGDVWHAEVQTPMGVRVPLYGHRSPSLSLECEADGFATIAEVVAPYNKSRRDRQDAMSQAGAQGGLVGALGAALIGAVYEGAINDEDNDEFSYAGRALSMKPLAPGASAKSIQWPSRGPQAPQFSPSTVSAFDAPAQPVEFKEEQPSSEVDLTPAPAPTLAPTPASAPAPAVETAAGNL